MLYNELGTGFLESVYENALGIVLKKAGLSIEKQSLIPIYFRDFIVGEFKADIVVEDKIILELKAVARIQSNHEAQLLNYLKATNKEVGLVMNFGEKPELSG